MQDLWTALEQRSRDWPALDRQSLADGIWADYVTARFARTGDANALQFLYPYLNRSQSEGARAHAIEVAARVFEGVGPQAVADLGYFTRNTASYLRDRAVIVVGATVTGADEDTILDVLSPYLNSPNQFTQRLAMGALAAAAAGSGSEKILAEIRRVAETGRARQRSLELTMAELFSGRPTEEVYGLVVRPETVGEINTGNERAASVLVRGASDEWYQRVCREVIDPRLHAEPEDRKWRRQFLRRDGIFALTRAAGSRGMEALEKMLHLRSNRCTGYALLNRAPRCFAGADVAANRSPLLELLRSGDVPAQRIAAVCLGALVDQAEEPEAVASLTGLCGSRNGAARAGALTGLGMAARTTCDENLRKLCLDAAEHPETATEAVHALGRIFQGSGRSDVFEDIRTKARAYRNRPVKSSHRFKPLVECYRAVGLLYQGTGSAEPMDFLLPALAPSPVQWDSYRWAAGKALVLIEFSQRTLDRAFGTKWR